jgi:hypothetical protein
MSNERPGQGPGRETLQEPWRERFDDLKSAYVLGALDESERREFEGYLAAHPELQAEVDELDSIADLLSLSPQEQAPPPELRRNLLGKIEDASVAPPQRRARSYARIFVPGGLAIVAIAAIAAAVLAIVGLPLWNASLRDENEDLRGSFETRETHEMQDLGPVETCGERSSRLGRKGRSDGGKPIPHSGG